MKYKMIASDYDGTIYPFNAREVLFYTKETIHRYIAAGGIFVLSTGRIFSSIRPEAERLGLSGDLICLQGSAVYSLDSGELKASDCLSIATATSVLKFGEDEGRICQMYYGKDYYTAKENNFTTLYAEYCNVQPQYTNCKLSEFVEQNGIRPFKIIILTEPNEASEMLRRTREHFKDSVDVSRSGPMYIEIVSPTSGKGNAVKRLADSYGINIEDVAVFGDALNDISMLKVAGLAVAVGNAMDEVKAVADIIAEDASDCGVAKIIERIISDTI
ncbi:MAG: HAD family phosphatase [Clostridia bacterium]|nr:HAD family phosphatase [Clostridia bacterium]